MLRLRTTAMLSLLALAMGVGGTDWLSGRSSNEPLALDFAPPTTRSAPMQHRLAPHVRRAHALAVALHTRHGSAKLAAAMARPSATAAENPIDFASRAAPPELVPLEMPLDHDTAYQQQRGHLDGRVVMRVSVDGAGHVNDVSIAETSGDAALDAHALRSVDHWRFAVPADHPDGFSADLPMRFSSHDEPVASVP